MKKAVTKYFKDVEPEMKNKINEIIRGEERARRELYYKDVLDSESLPWFFKEDYINSLSLQDINLEAFCPECGNTAREANFIKETGWEVREVTVRCKCGCIYSYCG